jgi:N-acyl homoserine lactone hydrolase
MPRPTKVAVSFALVAFSLMMEGTTTNAESTLPDPFNVGVVEKLFRLDCGRSLANDESVWTPGENVGRSIEFSSTCWLVKHGNEWLLWDTGVPEAALNDPKGWSTLPKLIVYHLDRALTDQLAEIGLKPRNISRVAISHTHGDHIGNVVLFPDSTILMQRAEYVWINSGDGPNDNVNQLMALARKLLGTPKNLQLIDGDSDVFGDGSVTLVSTGPHPRQPVAAGPSQEFRLHHSLGRRGSFGREFREEQSSVPQYRQVRINRVDGKNQADDRRVQGDTLHQP